jgi:hypothetical protein
MTFYDDRQPPSDGGSRRVTLACPDGVPPEILSAWRDGLLPPDQAAWLARHTPTCLACHERLGDYDAAASALNNQAIPRPGSDLWPAVRDSITRESRGAAQRAHLPRGLALGGIGAGVAALLLVALFAVLLISHLPGRATAGSTPTATLASGPTATRTTTATPSGPGVWTTVTGCTGVPDALRIQYNASIQQQKGGPTLVTLERSDNCGATWTQLTPPPMSGVNYTTNVNTMTILVSPLNPTIAILTVQVENAPVCSASTSVHAEPIRSSTSVQAKTPSSSTICQPQFVTNDGGVHWRQLHLPVQGTLGNAEIMGLGGDGQLLAQGSRLYGVVSTYLYGSSGVLPPGRLVASDDGGLSWHVADAALAAQGLAIYDCAPVATGSAIYVTAEPVNDPLRGPPTNGATLTTWVSLDGGQTWTRKHNPSAETPTDLIQSMYAVVNTSGQRALYDTVANKNSLVIEGSLDDGATWQANSVLNSVSQSGTTGLLGGLPDGSLLVNNPAGQQNVLAWFPGSIPRAVAQYPGLLYVFNAIVEQRANGVYLWLSGQPDGNTLIIEYTQLKLT